MLSPILRALIQSIKSTHMLRLVLIPCFLFAIQARSFADVIISASSSSNIGPSTPAQTGTSGSVTDSAGGSAQTDFTQAITSARFGELKAYGLATAGLNPAFFGIFAFNTAFFRDDFLFNASGLAGTSGTVEVKFTVDGTLLASRTAPSPYVAGYDGNVRASASYTFTAGNNNTFSKTESLRTAEWAAANGFNAWSGTQFLGIEQTYTVPFTFGTLLEGVGLRIDAQASAIGSGPNGFSSIAKSDLGHTAKWGGFGAVRDANGNVISNYTFSSGSGFNYALGITAVPEPSSGALLATCLAVGIFRRSRRNSQKV